MEVYLGFAFILILLYLLLKDAGTTNTILHSFSQANVGAIKALQGR